MSHSCPICGKAGLSDYRKEHVVCTQCDTDLEPFLLLSSIARESGKKRELISLFSVVITVAFAVITFLHFTTKPINAAAVTKVNTTVSADSTTFYVNQIKKLKHKIESQRSNDDPIIIRYKVRKGDSASKIAKFFYNDLAQYTLIEADNNLKRPYYLIPGQILTIKLRR